MADRPASNPKDVEKEASIQRAIKRYGTGMRVKVKGSHATVSGTVEDYETKRAVYSVVQASSGIEKVTNNVRVMAG